MKIISIAAFALCAISSYAQADWTQHMCFVGGQIPEWAQTKRDWKAPADRVPEIGQMITDVQIWPTDEEKMRALFSLSDAEYVELVKARAREFLPYDNVVLQFGNELTRPRSAASFTAETGLAFTQNWIAEYARRLVLAVDAYREVDNSKRLILGSIVTGSKSGRNYLLDLMLYQLPDGRQVHQIIDIVSVHYTTPPTFVTDLFPDMPVWTTEEIGIRVANGGRGYDDALKELATHLIYWEETRQPSAQLCFYASNTGSPSASDAMAEVLGLFGRVRLYATDNGGSYTIYDDAGNTLQVN